MISAHKLPDSVGVHGRACVCRSEFRALCALCVFCSPCAFCSLFRCISLLFLVAWLPPGRPRSNATWANVPPARNSRRWKCRRRWGTLRVRFWALLQLPLQLLGFASCFCGVDFFFMDVQWYVTLLRCPVGEGCDQEVEYSWHVPLTAPIRVLAVKADEWFLQVVHRVFGSLELGRHLFVSLSWAYFMVTALSVRQPPLNGVAFAADRARVMASDIMACAWSFCGFC